MAILIDDLEAQLRRLEALSQLRGRKARLRLGKQFRSEKPAACPPEGTRRHEYRRLNGGWLFSRVNVPTRFDPRVRQAG